MYILHKLKGAKFKLITRLWDMASFIFPKWFGKLTILFLRKTNTFIKSKYSKNRQWSKSIVYFGLWFGVICAFTFTYYNYRFMFSFSYLWWAPALVIFLAVMALARKSYKYFNLYFLSIYTN